MNEKPVYDDASSNYNRNVRRVLQDLLRCSIQDLIYKYNQMIIRLNQSGIKISENARLLLLDCIINSNGTKRIQYIKNLKRIYGADWEKVIVEGGWCCGNEPVSIDLKEDSPYELKRAAAELYRDTTIWDGNDSYVITYIDDFIWASVPNTADNSVYISRLRAQAKNNLTGNEVFITVDIDSSGYMSVSSRMH
ncbi:MAG: hypothetical protein OHK0017_07580 [Patescibacteria group bacterium]